VTARLRAAPRLAFALSLLLGPAVGARAAADAPPACVAPLAPGAKGPDVDETCVPAPPPSALVTALSTLRTPGSPALAAVGLGAGHLDPPTTPTGASVSSQAGSSASVLSVDVDPYWLLFTHPHLTHRDLEEQPYLAWARDGSFSVAGGPGQIPAGAAGPGSAAIPVQTFAAGSRTTLYPGWASPAALYCGQVLDRHAAAVNRALTADGLAALQQWSANNPRPRHTDPGYTDDKVKAWNARANRALDDWKSTHAQDVEAKLATTEVRECLDVVHQREGFVASAAVAHARAYHWSDKIGSEAGRATTLWATAGYVLTRDVTRAMLDNNLTLPPVAADVSLLLSVRKRWESVGGVTAEPLDIGGRVVVAWSRYGLSAEALCRCSARADWGKLASYQATGMVDYHLKSGAWASLAFGRDYGDFATGQTYKLLAGIEINFGMNRLVAPDTSLAYPIGGSLPEQK
jgi:hypothetical protein